MSGKSKNVYTKQELKAIFANIEKQFEGKSWANIAEEEGLFNMPIEQPEPRHATIVEVPTSAAANAQVEVNGMSIQAWIEAHKPLRINGKTLQEWLATKKDKRDIYNGPSAKTSPGIKENDSPSLLVTGFDTHHYDLADFVLVASLGGSVRDIYRPQGKNFLFVEMVGADAAQRVVDMFTETPLKIGKRKIMFDVSVHSSSERYKGKSAASGSAKKTHKKRMGGGGATNNAKAAAGKARNLAKQAMGKAANAAKDAAKKAAAAAEQAARKTAVTVDKIGREMGSYAVESATSMQGATTDPFATVKSTAKEIKEGIEQGAKKTLNSAKRLTKKRSNRH
jgi:hypothetical protein